MSLFVQFKSRLIGSSSRNKEIGVNILVSLVSKFLSIVSSLLIIPLTINYVNPTQYGIWLTISTVVGWISFFDLGLGNGFRNKFATARAEGNDLLAKQYLSTAYISITFIVSFLFIILIGLNYVVEWDVFLNVDSSYGSELKKIFFILSFFFCLNMVVNLFGTLLTANQKPGYTAAIHGLSQLLSLLAIFILTKTTKGSLVNLALFFSSVPALTMFLFSIIAFNFTRYKNFSPKISLFKFSLLRGIFSLGYKFFLIYLCIIAIFQIINIIISREVGPLGVSQYTVANKYFSIIYMVVNIVVSPLWSAFTDAYAKKDFVWMKKVLHYLERALFITVVMYFVMLIVSEPVYKLWVGENLSIPFSLSLGVMLLMIVQTSGIIYMSLINGIGTIKIQLLIYIIFAILSWPLMTYSIRIWGLNGVVVVPTLVYAIQSIIGKVQLCKILNNRASGLWKK